MTWQLREPETVVIVLGDNQSPGHVGRDTLIVSLLKYPLTRPTTKLLSAEPEMLNLGQKGTKSV